MIRVALPYHLRNLAQVGAEVELDVAPPISVRSILDALEARFPMLRGTIRDHVTLERRPLLRFFASEQDVSLDPPDTPLPAAIAEGREPLWVIGAIAGGMAKKARTVNLYVGTSGYSYPAWKGSFYPEKLSGPKMLGYYGEHFRTVESNSTFRFLPKASAVEGWAKAVPAGFRFALKAPQAITHFKRLKGAAESVAQLFAVAEVLKERLGPILFQLPPNFKKDLPVLQDFLALLPSKRRVAFEFRHQSWFDDEVIEALREQGAALCLAEADTDLEIPFVATTDWGYLRLRQPEYSDAELKNWLKQIRDQNWQDAFVFFKHEDEGKGPKFAKRLMELAE